MDKYLQEYLYGQTLIISALTKKLIQSGIFSRDEVLTVFEGMIKTLESKPEGKNGISDAVRRYLGLMKNQ